MLLNLNNNPKSKLLLYLSVLGIRDILVRIRMRIPGSVPLTNGSGTGSSSGSGSNSGSDSFLITFPDAHHLQSKNFYFKLKFCVKISFCRHCFSPLNLFMRKGNDMEIHLTNAFGSGFGMPKNMRILRIRIPNTGFYSGILLLSRQALKAQNPWTSNICM